jgi:hypothetical protein
MHAGTIAGQLPAGTDEESILLLATGGTPGADQAAP